MMKGLGVGLILVGILLGLIAAGIEVTVAGGAGYGDRIYNNGLLARRELLAIFSISFFIAGAMFAGSGHIAETLTGQNRADMPAAQPAPAVEFKADGEIEVAGTTVRRENGKFIFEGIEYPTEFDARRAIWRARHLGQPPTDQ